jgi:hypothetical protein
MKNAPTKAAAGKNQQIRPGHRRQQISKKISERRSGNHIRYELPEAHQRRR